MNAEEPAEKKAYRLVTAFFAAGLAMALSMAVIGLPQGAGLSAAVRGSLDQSGVVNPVTAVLLNFRSYDTLLEVCVLLLALLGVLTLTGSRKAMPVQAHDPALSGLVRLLVPLMALVSGYLLYEGAHAPGGAFQAGALLGSAIVLSRLAGLAPSEKYNRVFLIAAMLGFAAFLLIAAAPFAAGRNFIEYHPEYAQIFIFTIEAALTISIALILYMLFSEASATDPRDISGGK